MILGAYLFFCRQCQFFKEKTAIALNFCADNLKTVWKSTAIFVGPTLDFANLEYLECENTNNW